MAAVLKQIDTVLLNVLKIVTITSFIFLTILITANVIVRFFPVVSLHWFDEIIELLYAYLVFYGAAALWILRGHICVGDWIEKSIPAGRMRHALPDGRRTAGFGFCRDLLLLFPAVDAFGPGRDERFCDPEGDPLFLHARFGPRSWSSIHSGIWSMRWSASSTDRKSEHYSGPGKSPLPVEYRRSRKGEIHGYPLCRSSGTDENDGHQKDARAVSGGESLCKRQPEHGLQPYRPDHRRGGLPGQRDR